LLRRLLVFFVLLRLTADYCDPSVPGVFFFESDSYFVDSIEAKTAMPALTSPALSGVLPVRAMLEAPTPRATAIVHPSGRRDRHSPRSHVLASPPTAPESSEEH